MRLKGLGILAAWLFSCLAFAQKIHVSNQKDEPISEVFVYHDKRSYTAFTDENGLADISHFPVTGNFHFQHPSYQIGHYSADSLNQVGFKLTLEEKLVWFNELVVAASKWEQEKKDLSQHVLAVNRKTISENNPTTSADLLSQSGQVFVQKSQLGGGSPKLRGFSANAVLLVLDGIRMNNAIYRSGNLQNVINIDPNAIATSEVVFGPGSVIYGSDALGGVMDFHTVSPMWNQTGTKGEGNALIRYSSAANERTGHYDMSVARRKFTYFGSVTKTWMDDLRAGSNRSASYKGYFLRPNYVQRINGEDVLVSNPDPNNQIGSGFDLLNTVHKFKFLLNQHSDLSYNFYYGTTTNIPRYDRLTIVKAGTDSLENAQWYYGPQTWQMHSLQFNHYDSKKWLDQVKITAAFQDYSESRNDRGFGDEDLRTRTEQVNVFSLNLDLDKVIPNGDIFYGLDLIHNDVSSSGFRTDLLTNAQTPTPSRYPDLGSKMSSFALYLNRVKRLNDKWTFNLGARYNFVQLQGENANSTLADFSSIHLTNGSVTGSLGIIHLPDDKTKVGFNLSTGFRSPNVDDVGKLFEFDNDENGQPIIQVPNDQLNPEYAYNSEISYSKKVGIMTLNVVGFYTLLTNPILRGDFEINGQSTLFIDDDNDALTPEMEHGIVAQINGQRAYIYGGSFQALAKINDKLSSFGTISFSDGMETSSNEPLRHTTPFFGKIGVRWQSDKSMINLYSEFNGARWRADIPASEIEDKPYLYTDDGSPGWMTLNAKSNVDLNDFLRLDIGIENILDTHYRPYSSGISVSGRSFIIGLRGSF